MKLLLLALLSLTPLAAQDLQLFVHAPNAATDGAALGASYTFPDTAVYDENEITLRIRNTSTTKSYSVSSLYAAAPAAFTVSTNFRVLNPPAAPPCLAPGGSLDFSLAFLPHTSGALSADLLYAYAAYPASQGCAATTPGSLPVLRIPLTGQALPAVLSLAVTPGSQIATTVFPEDPVQFGNVPANTSETYTFTIQNVSSSSQLLPAIQMENQVFGSPQFTFDVSTLPASLAAGASASFAVKYVPLLAAGSQITLNTQTLDLGVRHYPLDGVAVAAATQGTSGLQVQYTFPNGVRSTASTQTPIDFGSVSGGSSEPLIFTVSNPQTGSDAIPVTSISVTGSAYALSNVPALPATLNPGQSITFKLIFTPGGAASSPGALTIGGATASDQLVFNLSGESVPLMLSPVFQLSPSTLASGEQAQLSINFPSAPQNGDIGTLTLSFTSAVAGVANDPAIVFVSSGTRAVNATIAAGVANATFNGQPSIAFQTGATAGTLKFTLSFADGESYSQTAAIAPATVQISSSSATRQSPYLIVNLTGIDNTYSASTLVFNFYGTSGNPLTPNGITIDATPDFHQYFFNGANTAGGAFNLQAKFPVTGDVSGVGSLDVTIQNSSGTSQMLHLNFQ